MLMQRASCHSGDEGIHANDRAGVLVKLGIASKFCEHLGTMIVLSDDSETIKHEVGWQDKLFTMLKLSPKPIWGSKRVRLQE